MWIGPGLQKRKKINNSFEMKAPAGHSLFATALSVGSGLLVGVAVYSIWLYSLRSLIALVLTVVFFGFFCFFLMRISARIMARLTGVEARRLEVHAALATASLLVIYLSFPLSFMYLTFHRGKEMLIAIVVFFLANFFIFFIVRRKWIILAVLVPSLVAAFIALSLYLLVNFISQSGLKAGVSGRLAYPFREQVTYSKSPGIPRDKKPACFRVHYRNHIRTGFWLPMNQSVESSVAIPHDGVLRFEVGVVHPGKDLAPARFLVFFKDSTGKMWKIMESFMNRQKVAWTRHEISLSSLPQDKGTIQFQVYSMDEKHENLKPLVLCNFVLFSKRDRPRGNVIVILLDALRADVLGCYGSSEVRTPVIDRLAGQGVLFEKATTACTWTLPAVASIFTSRMPSQHGIFSYFKQVSDPGLPTMPELLSRQGIFSKASIGNWVAHPDLDFLRGFNESFVIPLPSAFWRNTEALMEECADWLRSDPGGPFFLYIHNLDPHSPYFAPEPYSFGLKIKNVFRKLRAVIVLGLRSPYIYGLDLAAVDKLSEPEAEEMRQRYLGEVEYVDAQVAVVEQALKQSGLWQDTLVIITSDHGEAFQEHGTLRHGMDLHREVVRVPLIFTGGIMKGQSRRIKYPVSLMDLYPTILEFYGEPLPPGIIGQSLWPVIERETGEGRIVFSELVEPLNQKYYIMSAVKGEYHFIKKVPLRKSEEPGGQAPVESKLYRWDRDPEEQHDLSSIEPDMVRELEGSMDEFFESLPGKKRLDITVGDAMDAIRKRLKALGYIR